VPTKSGESLKGEQQESLKQFAAGQGRGKIAAVRTCGCGCEAAEGCDEPVAAELAAEECCRACWLRL